MDRSKRAMRVKKQQKSSIRVVVFLLIMFISVSWLCMIVKELNPVKAVMSVFDPENTSENEPGSESGSQSGSKNGIEPDPLPGGGTGSPVIVVVDPGHGGQDPGAVSPYLDGFSEKDITLDIGLKLRDKLEKAGIKVIMTREDDRELDSYWKEDVWARPRIANEAKATLFVSIHVNSFDINVNKGDTYNGTEVYHYASDDGIFTGKHFAEIVGEEIKKVADTKFNGVIKADYGVLRLSEMPAILIETAYITNRGDHKRLESDEFRENMAQGILNGTVRALETMGAYKEDGVYRIAKD